MMIRSVGNILLQMLAESCLHRGEVDGDRVDRSRQRRRELRLAQSLLQDALLPGGEDLLDALVGEDRLFIGAVFDDEEAERRLRAGRLVLPVFPWPPAPDWSLQSAA